MTEPEHRVARDAALLDMDAGTMERLGAAVMAVADEAVDSIIREVPSYTGALSGRMGHVIRGAVQLALGNFLKVARSADGSDPSTPIAQSTAAACLAPAEVVCRGRALRDRGRGVGTVGAARHLEEVAESELYSTADDVHHPAAEGAGVAGHLPDDGVDGL